MVVFHSWAEPELIVGGGNDKMILRQVAAAREPHCPYRLRLPAFPSSGCGRARAPLSAPLFFALPAPLLLPFSEPFALAMRLCDPVAFVSALS